MYKKSPFKFLEKVRVTYLNWTEYAVHSGGKCMIATLAWLTR